MDKKKIGIVIGLIIVLVSLWYFDVFDYISVETLFNNREKLIAFTSLHYLATIIIFMVSNILLGAIGVPVFAVFTLTAGLIFGFVEGMILSMTASLVGGYISFYLSRYALSNYFRRKYKHRIERIESKLKNKQFTVLLGFRLIPAFPYFLTNIVAGLSPIDEMTYLYATFLGIIPSTALFIYCGHVLRRVNSLKEVLTIGNFWPIIVMLLMTIVVGCLKLKKNKTI